MNDAMRELRFALLGDVPVASSGLPEAIGSSSRHRIVAAMGSEFPGVRHDDHWQMLVNDAQIDAALLFFPTDDFFEAARQFALHGKAVIVDSKCPLPSALVSECGLLDAEGTASVIPLFETRAVPALCELHRLITAGTIGEPSIVSIDRIVNRLPSDAAEGVLTDELMKDSEMTDIDLLRWVGGDYSQVTVLRTGATEHGYVGQALSLSGDGLPDATCTYHSGDSFRWMCRVSGSRGSAYVEFAEGVSELTVNGKTLPTTGTFRPDPNRCLQLLDDALARKPGSLRWQDRVRVHEIQEAMKRSLRRRRTIDLHFETTSERSQFKTQMATVGCFVLVYTFFASVFLLLAGAVLDPRDQLQKQAEAAGFVMPQSEFESETNQLTEDGLRRLADVSDRWQGTGAVVVIEGDESGQRDEADLTTSDRGRLDSVRRQLNESGVQRVDERTVVRRLAGHGFQMAMTIGRIIAFAPLGVFLLMQMFLLIARPAQGSKP